MNQSKIFSVYRWLLLACLVLAGLPLAAQPDILFGNGNTGTHTYPAFVTTTSISEDIHAINGMVPLPLSVAWEISGTGGGWTESVVSGHTEITKNGVTVALPGEENAVVGSGLPVHISGGGTVTFLTFTLTVTDDQGNNPTTRSYELSVNMAGSTGDPHLTTINGARYDFQAAGEFILLRQPNDLEIQVRHTPVATNGSTCVSINTAIAAQVGSHRVTYQPDLDKERDPNGSGRHNPNGLQLRVDGKLTDLDSRGIDLGNNARITLTDAPGGLRIDFPDGSSLFVTPGWWDAYGVWYLNLSIAPASNGGVGIAGPIDAKTWLPALPDGSSMGPLPANPHDRFVDLNQKFADAWRVTDANSLFDYAPGTSTNTFTDRSWPSENPPCDVPGMTPAAPIAESIAKALSQGVKGGEFANCVYDVMTTGNPGFAATYVLHQCVVAHASNKGSSSVEERPTPSKLNCILLGLLLGLLIGLLICWLWRKLKRP